MKLAESTTRKRVHTCAVEEARKRSGVRLVEVEGAASGYSQKIEATMYLCSAAKSKCKGEVISPRNGQNVFLS